jgi:hypothetical protein
MVKFQPDPFLYPHHSTIPTGVLINTNDKKDDVDTVALSEEDLLLASTVVLGYSFTDKIWRAFLISPQGHPFNFHPTF